MEYRPIGRSGLITSTLTLGTMIFGEGSQRATPKADAVNIIHAYLDHGGNHLDTADVYAGGESERIIGEALKGRREEVIISSKIRFRTADHINGEGLSRLHIIRAVNASLERLGTEYMDLLYLHCFDPITPIEETLRTVEDLIKTGKVRYVGISNFKAWQVMKAQGLTQQLGTNPFIAAQYQYSLVKRDVEYEFFDLFESEGIGLLPWGPLGGGFLSGKYPMERPQSGRIASVTEEYEEAWHRRNTRQNWEILDVVKDISEKHRATPSQISLAWILAKPVIPSLIMGIRTREQLLDNLQSAAIPLSVEEIHALDRVSALPELYPYRMIDSYGQRSLT